MADDIIDQLLRLQDQDMRIMLRERERDALPNRIKALDNDLESFRAAIAETETKRKHAQLVASQVELDVETQRQKIARLRDQQILLKTNREFRAMEDEINAAQSVISQLETRLLEAMESMDVLSDGIKARTDELRQAEKSIEQQKQSMENRMRDIDRELDELQGRRKIAAQAIPKPWLPSYDRLFKGKQDRVLVSVENGICGGCHMKLPPAVMHAARRSESLVTCDFCGRMLYSPDRMS